MTKSELIQRLSKRYPHLYQRDIEVLVNTMFDEITRALAEGNRVELRGFGAFSVRKREPRAARNPKNGAMVQVEERHAIYFRTGKELRERITNVAPKA
jgi:integration host factor subunit beta